MKASEFDQLNPELEVQKWQSWQRMVLYKLRGWN